MAAAPYPRIPGRATHGPVNSVAGSRFGLDGRDWNRVSCLMAETKCAVNRATACPARYRATGFLLLGTSLLLACGSPPPPPPPPQPEPELQPDIPTWCASKEKPCLPPAEFVARLCHGQYPETALYLFQKSTPWVRVWTKGRDLVALNAFGGPTGEALRPNEELLLLARRDSEVASTDKGVLRSDYLRWDGSCVTLAKKDVASAPLATPRHASVHVEALEPSLVRALMRDDKIRAAAEERDQKCVASADDPDCVKAREAVESRAVGAIHGGLKLPMPQKRP